ncbi:MAG: hypothetical protein U5L05_02990 [Rubrivivax sp.]|nr:hypothetical protein [Rubrivivax sp.]
MSIVEVQRRGTVLRQSEIDVNCLLLPEFCPLVNAVQRQEAL